MPGCACHTLRPTLSTWFGGSGQHPLCIASSWRTVNVHHAECLALGWAQERGEETLHSLVGERSITGRLGMTQTWSHPGSPERGFSTVQGSHEHK